LKLIELTKSDIELEDKVGKIMANGELLKGKEYIDHSLALY
jgi:hypothetical protein